MTTGTYCLTDWLPSGADASVAFARIFDDIDKHRLQGALVFVPPATFRLTSTVVIRHDFLTIAGYNNGFQTGTDNGGGSRIRVEAPIGFHVPAGRPQRLRSFTLRGLLLDGGAVNAGRKGLLIENASDNVVIEDNAIKEFAAAVTLRAVDALHVRNNMLLENISCLRLEQGGIASIVSNNRIGGKPGGISLLAEAHERLVISANNIFPDGYANVVLEDCRSCVVTGNQLHSFYTGMLHLEGDCADNVVVGNQFLSTEDPNGRWNANLAVPRNPDFGLIRVEGRSNLITANGLRTRTAEPHTMIVVDGFANTVSDLHFDGDGEFVPVHVQAGAGANANVVLDCVDGDGLRTEPGAQVRFRALPSLS